MIRKVIETDEDGNPIVVVWRETPAEKEVRKKMLLEQAERGRQVAVSVKK